MTHRVQLEPAFVLHKRPYRNTSLIVELFTPRYGRVVALARSARGLKSRYAGKLELFFPLLLSWSGQRELKWLGDMELLGMPYLLDGRALICGLYLNELLLRLLHREDPHAQLFTYYHEALQQLAGRGPIAPILRCFEKKLLMELGYGLAFHRDIETGLPIDPNQYYYYVPERGFSVRSSVNAEKFSGKSLIACHEEVFVEDATGKEAKHLMQMALARLLGEKPLKTRELF